MLLAPSADAALIDLRVRYVRNIERRMPAHVTMLFPFRSPVDEATVAEIKRVCTELMPFDARFSEVGRFRDDVIWLRPDPSAAFSDASDSVLAAFPDCSLYGGAHATRTLHLTVASRLRGGQADQLVNEVRSVLPLTDRVDQLTLMVEHDGGWRNERSWPFGGGPR